MKSDPTATFKQALAELRQHLSKNKKASPSRFHARALLCSLGEVALDGGEPESLASELAEVVKDHREGWERAVREELELACTEHIQGVDPRFLKHPRYDFEYTVTARRRLEMRLRAVELMGLSVDERLLDQVAEADARLEPHLRD